MAYDGAALYWHDEIETCSAYDAVIRCKDLKQTFYIFVFTEVENLGFPTGQDSATFQDKETEDPLLSQDKGTMG